MTENQNAIFQKMRNLNNEPISGSQSLQDFAAYSVKKILTVYSNKRGFNPSEKLKKLTKDYKDKNIKKAVFKNTGISFFLKVNK